MEDTNLVRQIANGSEEVALTDETIVSVKSLIDVKDDSVIEHLGRLKSSLISKKTSSAKRFKYSNKI